MHASRGGVEEVAVADGGNTDGDEERKDDRLFHRALRRTQSSSFTRLKSLSMVSSGKLR